jgi:hypothetical protein
MAEHLNQPKPDMDDGFNNMGKPIPLFRKEAALKHAKAMGLDGTEAWAVVGSVAEQLERDEPYQAQRKAMVYLDLTGAYRLMAVLLTAPEPIAA